MHNYIKTFLLGTSFIVKVIYKTLSPSLLLITVSHVQKSFIEIYFLKINMKLMTLPHTFSIKINLYETFQYFLKLECLFLHFISFIKCNPICTICTTYLRNWKIKDEDNWNCNLYTPIHSFTHTYGTCTHPRIQKTIQKKNIAWFMQ